MCILINNTCQGNHFLSLHLCHHALPQTARQKRLLQLECVWYNESSCLEDVGTCIKRPLQLPEKHRQEERTSHYGLCIDINQQHDSHEC
jgi:hypothetical protein